MNPFNLPGEQFLMLFVALSIPGLLLAYLVHRSLLGPATLLDDPSLTPVEYAYLCGGPARAVHSELAHLVDSGKLTYDQSNDRLVRNGGASGDTDLERAMLTTGEQFTFTDAFAAAIAPLEQVRGRLQDQGLILTPEQSHGARRVPLMLVGALLLFGFIKIGVGMVRDRPVSNLVLCCVLLGGAGFVMFGRRRMLTRRGEYLLKQCRTTYAALRTTATSAPATLRGNDLRMAVGLFGATILTGTALAALHASMLPAARAHAAYGNSGWSDTGAGAVGSGCGGGGCGGGGGGGCGGGGCGGCGGGGD